MITTARLVKKRTDDGLFNMRDDIQLGKEYRVDLSTLRVRKGYNFIKDKYWEREMVQDVHGGWLPAELLEW